MTNSLPGIRSLFGQAWSLYKQRFWVLAGVCLLPVAAALLGSLFLGAGLTLAADQGAVGKTFFLIVTLLFVGIILFVEIWGQVALLYAIKDSPERIGIKESYRRGLAKYFAYCWVVLLTFLIVGGGILLLVVPGIILFVALNFALIVLVVEDQKGLSACLKSSAYVKGSWGSVCLRLFVILLLVLFIYLLLSLMAHFFPAGAPLFQFVIPLLFTPFAMAYWFEIYRHLKALRGEVPPPTAGKKTGFILLGILGLVFILAVPLLWMPFLFPIAGTEEMRVKAAVLSRDGIVGAANAGASLKKIQNLIDGRMEPVVLDFEPAGPCRRCFSEVLTSPLSSSNKEKWRKISERRYLWEYPEAGLKTCYEFYNDRLTEITCP